MEDIPEHLREFQARRIEEEVAESTLQTIAQYTPLTIVHGEVSTLEHREDYNKLLQDHSIPQNLLAEPCDLFKARSDLGEKEGPRTLLIRGRGGIGKSTFIRKIIRDWAEETMWTDTFTAVFSYELKDLNLVTEQLTCKELLCTYHGPSLPNETKEQHWKYILDNQKKVMIAFDGLDEFELFKGKAYTAKLYDVDKKTTVANIIYNLQKGNLLPRVRIMFTSRPIADALRVLGPFKRTVEVNGFDHDQRIQHIRTFNEGNEAASQYMLHAIEKDKNLKSFCVIPIICTMVCTCLQHIRSMSPGDRSPWHQTPKTITQMFALLVMLYTSEHHSDLKDMDLSISGILPSVRSGLLKLAKLAHWGLTKPDAQLVFTSNDLLAFDIMRGENKFGLLTSRRGPVHPIAKTVTLTHSFSHLLFQEFLGAVYMASLPWATVLGMLKAGHRQQEMMIVFLCGLWGDLELQQFLEGVWPEFKGLTNLIHVSN